MSLKKFKPTSPGQRTLIIEDRRGLWKGRPFKKLTVGLHQKGGRNNLGRKTARSRQGGHKRLYRFVDFRRKNSGVSAEVLRVEYDPNRSAYILLVRYEDGAFSYVLAPQRVSVGDKIMAGEGVDIKPGNALPLSSIPIGTLVHNVELKPGRGGQLARSAGAYARVVSRDQGYVVLALPSGEQRRILSSCMATVGVVSNPDHGNINLGKAGRNRWRGVRPHCRGVAMNPVDHPHGGGEGRTSGGRHPCSPSGLPTKGRKTRSRKKLSSMFIVRSRHALKSKGR